MEMRSDTIAAISTAIGRSGIGIIRISGKDSLLITSKVIRSQIDFSSLNELSSRRLIHAFLLDINNDPVDEILIAVMPPN